MTAVVKPHRLILLTCTIGCSWKALPAAPTPALWRFLFEIVSLNYCWDMLYALTSTRIINYSTFKNIFNSKVAERNIYCGFQSLCWVLLASWEHYSVRHGCFLPIFPYSCYCNPSSPSCRSSRLHSRFFSCPRVIHCFRSTTIQECSRFVGFGLWRVAYLILSPRIHVYRSSLRDINTSSILELR